jgi:aryl-alcohol dehydrogenase-like predicted oxidoreductase
MVSRLGVASGYRIPAAPLEKAFHEHGINLFYWGTFRTAAMAEAIRNISKTDRAKLVVMLQTYDHPGWWVRRSVEKGLRVLGLDSVEILLLGWVNRYPSRKLVDACLKLQQEGKVKHLAVSGHDRPFHGKLAAKPDTPFAAQMLRYNAAHRGAEQEIFPLVPAANPPGIISYTATSWSQLLKPGNMPPGEPPMTAAECYRFALSNPKVDVCMTGPKNEEQLTQALTALDRGPLSPAEMDRARRIGDFVHRRKGLFF